MQRQNGKASVSECGLNADSEIGCIFPFLFYHLKMFGTGKRMLRLLNIFQLDKKIEKSRVIQRRERDESCPFLLNT